MTSEIVLSEVRDQYAWLFGCERRDEDDLPSLEIEDYIPDSLDAMENVAYSIGFLEGIARGCGVLADVLIAEANDGLEVGHETGDWVPTTLGEFWKMMAHEEPAPVDDIEVDDIGFIVRLAPGEEHKLGGGDRVVFRVRRRPT